MTEQVSIDFPAIHAPRPAGAADEYPPQPALLLTVVEAAQMLGCGRTLVYELLDSGELEAVKLHRLRRIPAEALRAYVTRLRRDQAA